MKGCQKISWSNVLPDGTRLPPGQAFLRLPDGGYDIMLEHVSNILMDPTNSFMYVGDATWSDPQMLVGAINSVFENVSAVCFVPTTR